MVWNPLQIRVDPKDGVMRDKYGREFTHNDRTFRKRRKNSAYPAVHAAEVKK